MYILANALKNLGRNKGRNILIGIMIFLIITASMVTLCINNTTRSIIDDYKNRFGSEVTIGADLTQLVNTGTLGTYQAPPAITPQQYLRFAESEYLKESRILASATAGGESIKAVDESENGNVQFGGGITLSGATQTEGDPYVSPKLNLFANKWSDFEEGNRELYEGKIPEKTGECIVSKELAELNDWKVGDKIQLESSVLSVEDSKQTIKNKTVELTLTGIYLDGTEPYSSQFKMPLMNRRNEVLTTLDTLLANYPNTLSVSAKYYLKKPSLLKSFDAELRAKGLDDYYKVSTDEAGYQKVVGPVEGLKKVALTFMLIVLIFGGVILVLLSSIAIRERKYEIGVLRAMGMKKSRVALGLWSEMLILTAVCLLLGFGAGSFAAQPVSDRLLASQIASAKQSQQTGTLGGIGIQVTTIGGTTPTQTALDEVDVSVQPQTVLQLTGIALLLASVASVAAVVKITRFEPIKILSDRN